MALRSTVYKAQLQRADIDRGVYDDHALTLALHPSETEERLMVRLLAYALWAPADDRDGALAFTRGLSTTDEPTLWQHALDGRLLHWVDVGLPDDRRVARACGRADRVSVLAYGTQVPAWWASLGERQQRHPGLHAWAIDVDASRDLAALAARTMNLQVNVQDGEVWVGNGERNVSLRLQPLSAAARAAAESA